MVKQLELAQKYPEFMNLHFQEVAELSLLEFFHHMLSHGVPFVIDSSFWAKEFEAN